MRKTIIAIIIASCSVLFSACITTTLLLKYATTDNSIDDRGCKKSLFSVAEGRTIKFTVGNLSGSQRDVSDLSKRYGEEKYGTGWDLDFSGYKTDGYYSTESYLFGECNNVRIKRGDKIVDGYRLLTAEEWEYLLFKRAASTIGGVENARFVIGKVNYKNGLIIFPDNYKHPRGVPEIFGANDRNGIPMDNSFNELEWDKMSQAGAIFLVEPCYSNCANRPSGYITSSRDKDGQVGFLYISTVLYRDVKIIWARNDREGLARLVVDN